MAYLDSADLVRRAKLRLARPSTDSAFTVSTTDDVWYDFLSEAQTRLTTLFAIYVPDAIWTVPTALTSADSGKTYTFGTDTDSAAIFALGHFRVYPDLPSIPDFPLIEGVDYTVENTRIRIPNDTTRTFTGGGPYTQYVAPSNVIAAATQPTVPKMARLPLITDAERQGWTRLKLYENAQDAESRFEREWTDVLVAIRTQGFGKGGNPLSQRQWSRTLDRWGR